MMLSIAYYNLPVNFINIHQFKRLHNIRYTNKYLHTQLYRINEKTIRVVRIETLHDGSPYVYVTFSDPRNTNLEKSSKILLVTTQWRFPL
jgi:hypothetical protein